MTRTLISIKNSSLEINLNDFFLVTIFKEKTLSFSTKLGVNGLTLLNFLKGCSIGVVFFDPRYRGGLEKMSYGNEGEKSAY